MISKRFKIVLVTAPDLKVARNLARKALKAQLVACANLIPQIESHYWWQGKIEKSSEILLLFKTTGAQIKSLEQFIVTEHPYDTPEFIVVPVDYGNPRYLKWIETNCLGQTPIRV